MHFCHASKELENTMAVDKCAGKQVRLRKTMSKLYFLLLSSDLQIQLVQQELLQGRIQAFFMCWNTHFQAWGQFVMSMGGYGDQMRNLCQGPI